MTEDPREKELDEELAPLGAQTDLAEEFDEELASLPPPPKPRGRNPIFMVAVLILSILFLWWVRLEISYFFSSSTPVPLGDAMELDPASLPENAYVTVEAWPNPARVVRYSQRLRGGTFRMFPVVGQKKLFIQTHAPEEDGEASEGDGSSLELGTTYTGRLVKFGSLSSSVTRSGYQNVRLFFREKLFIDITDDCWLVMDGMAPRSLWNSIVFAFSVVIFVVGVVNGVMLVRHLLSLRKKES